MGQLEERDIKNSIDTALELGREQGCEVMAGHPADDTEHADKLL